MRAIVGAHGKGGQIIQVAGRCGAEGLPFRFRIAGIDRAGENFLGDVVNFHSYLISGVLWGIVELFGKLEFMLVKLFVSFR